MLMKHPPRSTLPTSHSSRTTLQQSATSRSTDTRTRTTLPTLTSLPIQTMVSALTQTHSLPTSAASTLPVETATSQLMTPSSPLTNTEGTSQQARTLQVATSQQARTLQAATSQQDRTLQAAMVATSHRLSTTATTSHRLPTTATTSPQPRTTVATLLPCRPTAATQPLRRTTLPASAHLLQTTQQEDGEHEQEKAISMCNIFIDTGKILLCSALSLTTTRYQLFQFVTNK